MANIKITRTLPKQIVGIGSFTAQHELVWQHILRLGFRAGSSNSWQKGSRMKTSAEIAELIQKDDKTIPLTLAEITLLINDILRDYELIEEKSAEDKDGKLSESDAWLKAWGDLAKLRFSAVDEEIWQGLAHTLDSDGRHVIVCPTGRAMEYRIVGRNAGEVYDFFGGMDMPGGAKSRLQHIEDMIVDTILDLTEGRSTTDTTAISALSGSVFSAAIVRDLVEKEVVLGEDGGFAGWRVKAKKKITALDYCESSFESFLARAKYRVKHILPLSNNPSEPCYRYLDLTRKSQGSWDTWRQWMDETFELDNAKFVFQAWCGSLLDAGNTGKQSIWLHGHGNDGKSKVANALIKYLGDGACSINGKSMTNQFGLAKLEGKRLVVISDNKNQKLLQTEWAHNLTGGDSVDIERKGKDSYSAQLVGKLLVCANVPPEIRTDEANQVSRLIYIKMRRRTQEELIAKKMAIKLPDGTIAFVGNNDFPLKLLAEVEAYMQHCYGIYCATAPTRSDIPIPGDMVEATEAGASDPQSEAISDLVHDVFEFDTEAETPVRSVTAAINDCAKDYGLSLSNFTVSDINNYLINNGARKVQLRGEDGSRDRVWRGIKLKQASGL